MEDDVEYGEEGEEVMEEADTLEDGEAEEEDEEVEMFEEPEGDEGENIVELKRKLPAELVSQEEGPEKKKKKRKKSEKCLICGEKGHRKMDCQRLPEDRRKELQELYTMKVERKGQGTGRKKKKKVPAADCLPFETEGGAVEGQEGGEEGEGVEEGGGRKVKQGKERGKGKPKKDKSGAVIEKGEALFQVGGWRNRANDWSSGGHGSLSDLRSLSDPCLKDSGNS